MKDKPRAIPKTAILPVHKHYPDSPTESKVATEVDTILVHGSHAYSLDLCNKTQNWGGSN